ncbi:peptidase G2 autoproteolytic cleavage domain-containing protein [Lachnospiraceae bacterium 46-61]
MAYGGVNGVKGTKQSELDKKYDKTGGIITGNVTIKGCVSEGENTVASGDNSHAEGKGTQANGNYSHSEGSGVVADGNFSHAEGNDSEALGESSHAEGYATLAAGDFSHAEGGIDNSTNTTVCAHGIASHAEGEGTTTLAGAEASHAEGCGTLTEGKYSHAEGYKSMARGDSSHAEGRHTLATAYCSHVEGLGTIASKECAHAEGQSTTAAGNNAHAEGHTTKAIEHCAHAEGSDTIASGDCAHAEGWGSQAKGAYSHAGGGNTIANMYQTAIGKYNVEMTGAGSGDTLGSALVIGNGTSYTRSNCFRVQFDGKTYAKGTYSSSGADYAEAFEWFDGNTQNEDRVGRFVTLVGEKIRIAKPTDDYILGIVSGNPSVLGDVHDDQWKDMYETDIFGRPILEEIEVPEVTRIISIPHETGTEIVKTVVLQEKKKEIRQKLNPNYNNELEYIPRSQRHEWDAVGVVGKLVAIDDGTCNVDSWCAVGKDGIATSSEEQTRFRVMSRLDENHIKVFLV